MKPPVKKIGIFFVGLIVLGGLYEPLKQDLNGWQFIAFVGVYLIAVRFLAERWGR